MEYFTLLTALGQGMVADAIRVGQDINLKWMAVGDAQYTPAESQTSLMNEQARFEIHEITRDPANPNWVRIMAVIPPGIGGWHVYELGIFAEDGNLFAVAKMDGSFKPVYGDGMLKEIALDVILEVSSEANVKLVVDPHVILATRKWVEEYVGVKFDSLSALMDEHIKRIDNPHKVTAHQVNSYAQREIDDKDTAIKNSLADHVGNINNPHRVTHEQVNTYNKPTIDNLLAALASKIDANKALIDAISGFEPGMFAAFPQRIAELPAGWHYPSGEYVEQSSPIGQALMALSDQYKADWGVTVSGTTVSLLNNAKFFQGNLGRFIRMARGNSAAYQPGVTETDAIRPMAGTFTAYQLARGSATVTGVFGNETSTTAGTAEHSGSAPTISFNVRNVMTVANEIRPYSVHMTPAVFLGV
jgi:Phage-related tail fibre protein